MKRRNIGLAVVFSLITCGLYGLYWYYCLAKDLNIASDQEEDTSAGLVVLFSVLTCGIYAWFWMYKAGQKVAILRECRGAGSEESSVIYLILALCGLSIIDYCLIQNEINEYIDK